MCGKNTWEFCELLHYLLLHPPQPAARSPAAVMASHHLIFQRVSAFFTGCTGHHGHLFHSINRATTETHHVVFSRHIYSFCLSLKTRPRVPLWRTVPLSAPSLPKLITFTERRQLCSNICYFLGNLHKEQRKERFLIALMNYSSEVFHHQLTELQRQEDLFKVPKKVLLLINDSNTSGILAQARLRSTVFTHAELILTLHVTKFDV